MNYERFDTELTTAEPLSASEIRQAAIKRLAELRKEKKVIEQQEIDICMSISDPEINKKLITLTTKASVNIMQNELNYHNIDEETYKNFSPEDQEFMTTKKYRPIHNLHEKVSSAEEVSTGIALLKEEGHIDLRKQRHKKKPSDYITGLATSKLISDLAKNQKEMLERIARLEIVSAEHEIKLDQIGNALLANEIKEKALLDLGVNPKKVAAWKLYKEKQGTTMQQVADQLGKTRLTIYRWLKEIDGVIHCATK